MTNLMVQSRPMSKSGRWARRLVGVTAMAVALGVVFSAHPAPRTGAPGKGVPTTLQTFTPPPFCAGPLQVQGVNAFVCEFPVNWVFDEASLSQFATTEFGVTIQAVGGNGGDGGSVLGGTVGAGAGGQSGLAQATLRGDALAGKSLYIYVGNNGSFGGAGVPINGRILAAGGGNGGAATVVATQPLSQTPSDLTGILVAAGGGGGGQGFADLASPPWPCISVNPATGAFDPNQIVPCTGGGGGVAIAIDAQNRLGMGRPGNLPLIGYNFNLGNGQPAFFDAGVWSGGAPGRGGGTAGSGAFSFAGAPGEGSPAPWSWVRDNASLTLGSATVLGGNGLTSGGAGGGGVAGGGGANNASGAGGASFAVGSDYGLAIGEAFTPPCDPTNPQAFCARNWLASADTDQPTVVITFWEDTGANPLVPADGATIDTDQPSLVFQGTDASAGIHYVLASTAGDAVNFSGVINGTATGNFLWTVPPGLLDAGQSYNWYVTDQSGNQLQDPQSFTVAADTASSGLTQGWTLYVRSMDNLDSGLPTDLQPLGNQPQPTVSTSCSCLCTTTSGAPPASPAPTDSGYPSCSDFIKDDSCTCTWTASGEKPTDSMFWEWTPATGTGCNAGSGSCYANAGVNLGTIDVDWSSPTNPLNLLVPARLINLTSEPQSPTNGSAVPSLAVPAIAGLYGSCSDQSQVQVTFSAQTNGGVRFQIWADPGSGVQSSSPATAIDAWNIPSCSWSDTENINASSSDVYSNAYMDAQVYSICQTQISEQTGSQSFCLTPGMPYRVRFDAVVPYLPGPMKLGFKLPGMDASAPVPANWISTCTLDGTSGNCPPPSALPGGTSGHGRRPDHAGRPDNPGRPETVGPPEHAGKPDNPGYPGGPGAGSGPLSGADGTTKVPYLPGPTQLGFRLPDLDASAALPPPWISPCALDTPGGICLPASVVPGGSPAQGRWPAHAGRPDNPGRPETVGPPDHAGNPGHHGRPGPGSGLLSGEEGTAGAASCTAAGSTVSCTWTGNGTWQLPSLYTQAGGWITVQALGGAGGAGYPPDINLGGAGGRAQAVLPANAVAGETLYVYVGQNGAAEENYNCVGVADGCFHAATGGAASMVTTTPVPDSFISAGCSGTTAEGLDALAIGGGGGGGGINGEVSTVPSLGGKGGTAIGGSGTQNVIGTGTAGSADPGSYAGQAPGYGSNPYDGTQTVTGGAAALWWPGYPYPSYGGGPIAPGGAAEGYLGVTTYAQTWVSNTSILTLPTSDKQGCSGGVSLDAGGGGGGHAGGGGGVTQDAMLYDVAWQNFYGAGGGGGSSWAAGAGAGVTLPAAHTDWQTLANNDPSQVVISVDCPSCAFLADCAMDSTPQRPVMRCTLAQSTLPLSLDTLAATVAAEISQDVGDQVPVYLEAWGGAGGSGGTASTDCGDGAFADGGPGGKAGYARSSYTFGSLSSLTSELWLYIGAEGSAGGNGSTGYGDCKTTYGGGGAGGASSLVLSSEHSSSTVLDDVLLIAAGGGGGGQGRAEYEGYNGNPGDDGGSAIATASAAASASGEGRASASGNGSGACGVNPLATSCGTDGIGGRGGGEGSGVTGWVGTSVGWTQGEGGKSQGGGDNGGAGGGGYGGGEAGGSGTGSSEGGGAGGSYAAQATLDDSGAPVLGPDGSPGSGNGIVVISFDVCSTYPTLGVCQP